MVNQELWFTEKSDSRSSHQDQDRLSNSATLKFAAGGTEEDRTILDLCDAHIPRRYHELYLQSFDMDPLGGGIWEITANYGLVDRNQAVYNLDTSGGSARITQSLSTIARYGNAQDLKGAINFDGERVEGVDVQERRFAWNEQYTIPSTSFTQAYRITLFNLTYTINSAAFRGFAVGEVMFQGVTASQQGSHDVEATYYFEASPNRVNYAVGAWTVTAKRGWDYQWVQYQKSEAGNRLITQPDGVWIEQVYAYGNFALLGIGS